MKKVIILAILAILGAGYGIYNSSFITKINKADINIPIVSSPAISNVESGNVIVYFSKQDQHPEIALNNLINSATKTLDVAAYGLTYPSTVQAIVDASKRGVVVRVISDKVQSAGNTQKHAINILLIDGIPVKVDNHSGLMHLKMTIVDGIVATTGSYNYTTNATENNDEMLVIINDANFAQKCLGEFNRMWNDTEHYIDAGMSY